MSNLDIHYTGVENTQGSAVETAANRQKRGALIGTFAGYYGERNILGEKRPELAERMLKLFTQGGMMTLESVKVMDVKVELLCLPEVDDEKGIVVIYNYFEDDWWEGAGYNAETGRMWSYKIGPTLTGQTGTEKDPCIFSFVFSKCLEIICKQGNKNAGYKKCAGTNYAWVG